MTPYAGADWRALDGDAITPERWHGAHGFELRLPDGDAEVAIRVDRQTRRVSLSRRTIVESR